MMKIPYKGGGVALFQKNAEGVFSILLGKRINDPGKGKWSIPGGGFEHKDKNLFETARREFWEETGLNLNNIVVPQTPVKCHFWIPFCFKWLTLLYVLKDEWKLGKTHFHEFSEIKQIPLRELKNYKLAFGVMSEVKCFKRKYKAEV